MSTTAADYLRQRYLKTERPLKQQISDVERERDRLRSELRIEQVEHLRTRNERDMLARQLQKMSTQHTDARIMLTKTLPIVKRQREHKDTRDVYKELLRFFDIRDGEA